jgi:hypothetical protein
MGDAGKCGETRPSGGQVGRTLPVVDRYAERAAAGSEPADDVTVYPAICSGCDWLRREHAGVTAFHGRIVSRT